MTLLAGAAPQGRSHVAVCLSRRLLEELLSRVKSGMHLQLACFQAAPPPAVKI